MPTPDIQLAQDQLRDALKAEDIPIIYANGFINSMGNADILLILQRNGSNVAVVNLSYTVAKTLGERLSRMIAALEHDSGRKIMTTDEITKVTMESEANADSDGCTS